MQTRRDVAALFALFLLAAPGLAGDETVAPDDVAADAVPVVTQGPPDKQQLKAMFKLLAFDEDWRALKDPNVETDHWFPEIKQIELAKDWDLEIGGQVRYQLKDEVNRSLTGAFPGHDEFSLLRTRLHGDLRIQDDLRFYVELIRAKMFSQNSADPPPTATDENNLDLLNAFVEFICGPGFRFRVGRTELSYGAQRMIGPSDFTNTRKEFEGGVATFTDGDLSTDVLAVHPDIINPSGQDRDNLSQTLTGAYSTWKLQPTRTVDAYVLYLTDDDNVATNGAGSTGSFHVVTLGGRYAGQADALDWDTEAALQGGDWSGDNVRAWTCALTGGWTLAPLPGTPRLGLDIDTASGDSNATDGQHETFTQIYPTGHIYFGFLDLIGRANIIDVSPSLRWKLGDTATVRAAYHDFNLQNAHDSLYGVDGKPTLTDNTGNSGNHVGQEWDFVVGLTPKVLAPHSEIQFGYCYFTPGDFVNNLGDGKRAKLLYMQYVFTF